MLIFGAIVLLFTVVGFFLYLGLMVLLAAFFAFSVAITLVVGDPFLGFLLAIPATGITLWLVARNSERVD